MLAASQCVLHCDLSMMLLWQTAHRHIYKQHKFTMLQYKHEYASLFTRTEKLNNMSMYRVRPICTSDIVGAVGQPLERSRNLERQLGSDIPRSFLHSCIPCAADMLNSCNSIVWLTIKCRSRRAFTQSANNDRLRVTCCRLRGSRYVYLPSVTLVEWVEFGAYCLAAAEVHPRHELEGN